jgi:hypothetical protein
VTRITKDLGVTDRRRHGRATSRADSIEPWSEAAAGQAGEERLATRRTTWQRLSVLDVALGLTQRSRASGDEPAGHSWTVNRDPDQPEVVP